MKTRCILLLATCSLLWLSLAQSTSSFAMVSESGTATILTAPNLDQAVPDPISTYDIVMYALALLLVIYEWVVRRWPTVESYSVLTWIMRFLAWVVPDKYRDPSKETQQFTSLDKKWEKARQGTHII